MDERRKKPLWPWIVATVVAGAIAALLVFFSFASRESPPSPSPYYVDSPKPD